MMMRSMVMTVRARARGVALSTAVVCLAPVQATAQTDSRLSLGVSAAHVDLRALDASETLEGFLVGIEGSASLSRFYVAGEYRLGWLGAAEEDGSGRRAVSARAALGVRVFRSIMIEGGPWISKIDLPVEDGDVIRWRLGIAGRLPLVTDLVSGYARAAGSFAGTGINRLEAPAGGLGEVGLVAKPTDSFWVRLGYRVERESFALTSARTSESAFLTVGVSTPRARSDWERR